MTCSKSNAPPTPMNCWARTRRFRVGTRPPARHAGPPEGKTPAQDRAATVRERPARFVLETESVTSHSLSRRMRVPRTPLSRCSSRESQSHDRRRYLTHRVSQGSETARLSALLTGAQLVSWSERPPSSGGARQQERASRCSPHTPPHPMTRLPCINFTLRSSRTVEWCHTHHQITPL